MRWRSASARVRSEIAEPSARSCAACRAKSWRMRLKTESLTSSGNSMLLTRTSTSVMPRLLTFAPEIFSTSPRNSLRSAATTCWIVRRAITPLMPSLTISPSRAIGDVLAAARRRSVVARDVGDAPFHEQVDAQDLAFAGQELLRRVFLAEDALVELDHVVHERRQEMQPRLVVGAHDFAEAKLHREFRFAHGERSHREQQDGGADQDQRQVTTIAHQRVPRSRRDSTVLTAGASAGVASRAGAVAGTWRCSSSVSVRTRPSPSLSSGR